MSKEISEFQEEFSKFTGDIRRFSNDEIQAFAQTMPRLMQLARFDIFQPLIAWEKQYWYRLRTCGENGFANLHEVIYPPVNAVKDYGRANIPNDPVHYASRNTLTALSEVPVARGDYLQVVAVSTVKDTIYPCFPIGEAHNLIVAGKSMGDSPDQTAHFIKNIEGLSHKESLMLTLLDSFLSKVFRTSAKHSQAYRLSAQIAAKLMLKDGGLMYPSVHVPGGLNIAIPAAHFNQLFEVKFTEIIRVDDVYDDFIYDITPVKFSCTFEDDGTIQWNGNQKPSITVSLKEGRQMPQDYNGWRVPANTNKK